MSASDEVAPARHGPLIAALRRAGIPDTLAERLLIVVALGVYDAIAVTPAVARRRDRGFDPLTALLGHIDAGALGARHGLDEDLVATALSIVLPRLLHTGGGAAAAHDDLAWGERIAVGVLARLLQHRFPPAPTDAG